MQIAELMCVLWKAPTYKKRPPHKKRTPGVEWRKLWCKIWDLYFFRRKVNLYIMVEYTRAKYKPVEHRQPSRRFPAFRCPLLIMHQRVSKSTFNETIKRVNAPPKPLDGLFLKSYDYHMDCCCLIA
jgi:hypothetical protein